VVEWFKRSGADAKGYQSRINKALRDYIEAQEQRKRRRATKPALEHDRVWLKHQGPPLRGVGQPPETSHPDALLVTAPAVGPINIGAERAPTPTPPPLLRNKGGATVRGCASRRALG